MKRAKKRIKSPPEGTWFAVPLRTGGYAVGIVARTSGKGITFGYFFDKKWDRPPTLAQLAELSPQRAVRLLQFGDLGLINGTWPILGQHPHWKREEWPMPDFFRKEELRPVAWRIRYSDTDPSVLVSEIRVDYNTVESTTDGLDGAGSVEIEMTDLCQR